MPYRFTLSPTDPDNIRTPPTSLLPPNPTLDQCVANYFDLQSIPTRYFFELLSHFTSDQTEREKFVEFTTAEVGMLDR